jgi:hypothetical protein
MRLCYYFYGIVIVLAMLVLAGCKSETTDEALATTPAGSYEAFVLRCCDQVEARIPEFTKLAEKIADMHAAGGNIGVIWEPRGTTGTEGPQYEIKGRSGGMTALDYSVEKGLPTASRDKDVAIIGWQRAPKPGDLDVLKKYREHYFILAFGPKELPALAEHVKLCDAWIDTGLGADDRGVTLPDGTRAGQCNMLVNALNAWAFQGELIAALTRRGKMPTMLKSHSLGDEDWNTRYRNGKMLFHNDLQVQPIAPGTISREYLNQIRGLVRTFAKTQQPAVERSADYIVDELHQGRKTYVAQTGHTTFEMVGQFEDRVWAVPMVFYQSPSQLKRFQDTVPDGALVYRVGYTGEEKSLMDFLKAKKLRVMMLTSNHDTRPDYQLPTDMLTLIDMGWAFGDACVKIKDYPAKIFPPSGVMQIVGYEAVNVEVLARLAREKMNGK